MRTAVFEDYLTGAKVVGIISEQICYYITSRYKSMVIRNNPDRVQYLTGNVKPAGHCLYLNKILIRRNPNA